MKKLLLLILPLMLNIGICQSMYVRIPKSKVLFKCFNEMLLSDFYLNSNNISQIAGQEVNILIVLGEVNKALLEYSKCVDSPTASFIYSLKFDILEILFGDSYEKLEQLKSIMIRLEKARNNRLKKRTSQGVYNSVVFPRSLTCA